MRRPTTTALFFCALVSVYTSASQPVKAPETRNPAERLAGEGARQNESPRQPEPNRNEPLTVIIEKMPDESQADAEQRQREIRTQDDVALYTGLLTILATVTLGFVGWQAWLTKRSVEASERSIESNVRLTKILHKQWVEVSYRFSLERMRTSKTDETQTRPYFEFHTTVRNPTPRFLRVVNVEVYISPNSIGEVGCNQIVAPDAILYPAPLMILEWDAQKTATINSDGEGLVIVGRVNFKDSFGDDDFTYFGASGELKGDQFKARPYMGSLEHFWDVELPAKKRRLRTEHSQSLPGLSQAR